MHSFREVRGVVLYLVVAGLSTRLLSFLAQSVEEALKRLEERTAEVVASTAQRTISFHHKVQEEIITLNLKTRDVTTEMEELEPCEDISRDLRCEALTADVSNPLPCADAIQLAEVEAQRLCL